MIRLGGIVTLKPLAEADDNFVSIGFGRYKQKGKEKDPNSPTFKKDDAGKFVPTKDDTSKGDEPKKTAPKVNIFDKPAEEPKKDEPTSEPKKIRQGNPAVNKATKSKAEKLGITPEKLGKDEYQKKMAQAAIEALTDSNFHNEARALIASLEGKPEWAEKPTDMPSLSSPEYGEWRKNSVYSSEYYDADEDTSNLGQTASQKSGWDGGDAVAGIAFTLRMNGFHKLADKIQSVIKESKSTKLTSLIKK
jgi:hypothetical protein